MIVVFQIYLSLLLLSISLFIFVANFGRNLLFDCNRKLIKAAITLQPKKNIRKVLLVIAHPEPYIQGTQRTLSLILLSPQKTVKKRYTMLRITQWMNMRGMKNLKKKARMKCLEVRRMGRGFAFKPVSEVNSSTWSPSVLLFLFRFVFGRFLLIRQTFPLGCWIQSINFRCVFVLPFFPKLAQEGNLWRIGFQFNSFTIKAEQQGVY